MSHLYKPPLKYSSLRRTWPEQIRLEFYLRTILNIRRTEWIECRCRAPPLGSLTTYLQTSLAICVYRYVPEEPELN